MNRFVSVLLVTSAFGNTLLMLNGLVGAWKQEQLDRDLREVMPRLMEQARRQAKEMNEDG
jgi:hypothetical protein